MTESVIVVVVSLNNAFSLSSEQVVTVVWRITAATTAPLDRTQRFLDGFCPIYNWLASDSLAKCDFWLVSSSSGDTVLLTLEGVQELLLQVAPVNYSIIREDLVHVKHTHCEVQSRLELVRHCSLVPKLVLELLRELQAVDLRQVVASLIE